MGAHNGLRINVEAVVEAFGGGGGGAVPFFTGTVLVVTVFTIGLVLFVVEREVIGFANVFEAITVFTTAFNEGILGTAPPVGGFVVVVVVVVVSVGLTVLTDFGIIIPTVGGFTPVTVLLAATIGLVVGTVEAVVTDFTALIVETRGAIGFVTGLLIILG